MPTSDSTLQPRQRFGSRHKPNDYSSARLSPDTGQGVVRRCRTLGDSPEPQSPRAKVLGNGTDPMGTTKRINNEIWSCELSRVPVVKPGLVREF